MENLFVDFSYFSTFLLTASERKLDYYHQNVNVRDALRVAQQFKTKELWKLGNFKEISEIL